MFGYLRIFSIISMLVVIGIAISTGMSFRTLAEADLTNLIETNNAGMSQGYINTVWKRYRGVILPAAANPATLKDNSDVAAFAQDTVRYFQRMPLVRVNIYSATGQLLLSDNVNAAEKPAGTKASPDSNFVLTQLKQPSTISQVIAGVLLQNTTHATMVQTLIPLRIDPTASVSDGMLEILYNVTTPWQRLASLQMLFTGGIITLFLTFLYLMFRTSKKAESIIAKQHEANVELAEAAAMAQAENQEKSQFLANISHELRTPLNAVIGFSDILKTEVIAQVPEKKYHDYINDIHASGVHLLSLINDILDYSKAEAGKLALEVSEVNVNKMVQNCMRLVSPRAEDGQVKLVEQLPKDQLPMMVDGKKFKQVLLNLLSNAVKFTPAGGEVRVSAWHNVTDDSYSFEVQDTGIGIAPKDISRAMAPFGQVDNTLKRKYEGTGLGLPLTKKFVELMGGKFNITSEVNKGTTITFTLPREVKQREGLIIKQAS